MMRVWRMLPVSRNTLADAIWVEASFLFPALCCVTQLVAILSAFPHENELGLTWLVRPIALSMAGAALMHVVLAVGYRGEPTRPREHVASALRYLALLAVNWIFTRTALPLFVTPDAFGLPWTALSLAAALAMLPVSRMAIRHLIARATLMQSGPEGKAKQHTHTRPPRSLIPRMSRSRFWVRLCPYSTVALVPFFVGLVFAAGGAAGFVFGDPQASYAVLVQDLPYFYGLVLLGLTLFGALSCVQQLPPLRVYRFLPLSSRKMTLHLLAYPASAGLGLALAVGLSALIVPGLALFDLAVLLLCSLGAIFVLTAGVFTDNSSLTGVVLILVTLAVLFVLAALKYPASLWACGIATPMLLYCGVRAFHAAITRSSTAYHNTHWLRSEERE